MLRGRAHRGLEMSNIDRTNCVTTAGGELNAGDRRRVAQVSLGVAASMLMASAASAQTNLPPLAVETKKAPAKAKAKAAPRAKQAPPPVAEAPPPGPIDPSLIPGSYVATTASSTKQTAPLLNTPQTVTVIPGTIIQERQATNLTEVLRNTPGITFEGGENAFGASPANFAIRGFNASDSIFVDGVRSSGSYPRDAFNIDRVEVFKGPAADNGRGSAGGYVNIVTKTAEMDNFVRGEVGIGFDEYDSEMRKRATFDINQRFGTTGVRLNGMVEDGGVAGRDIAEAKAWGIAPTITFGMGTDTRLTISYEHVTRDDLPDWGVPAAMVKGTFRYSALAARASRDNFFGHATDYNKINANSVLARWEHDLSDNFTVSAQLRWSNVDHSSAYTIVGNPAFISPDQYSSSQRYHDRENDSLSGQVNLAGSLWFGGFKHTISTGVEFTRESADGRQFGAVTLPNDDIFNPDPWRGSPIVRPPATQTNGVDIRTAAAYFYDTIQLSRHWELTGGMRVERYEVDLDHKLIAGGPASALDGYSFEDTALNGKIGLVYKPVENGSFYISYGQSAMPPASLLSNPDISRTGTDAFPGLAVGAGLTDMRNYEIGTKWSFFGGNLTTSAALFRTEKDQPIRTRLSDTIWESQQVVQGLELSAAGNLTPRWKIFGGIVIMDSERHNESGLDAELRTDRPGDYTSATATTDGDELAFTPKVSGALWSTYKLTDFFTVGAGVQYVGESWVGRPDDAQRIIKNGLYGKQPSYFLVNAMASYELTENIKLNLNIDNIFDEKYAQSMQWNANRALLGSPRTYWLSASFKY